jgi:hypothetical protein
MGGAGALPETLLYKLAEGTLGSARYTVQTLERAVLTSTGGSGEVSRQLPRRSFSLQFYTSPRLFTGIIACITSLNITGSLWAL